MAAAEMTLTLSPAVASLSLHLHGWRSADVTNTSQQEAAFAGLRFLPGKQPTREIYVLRGLCARCRAFSDEQIQTLSLTL